MNLLAKEQGFFKKILLIALPIALQGLITTGVNAMDTVMVGSLGETELSAVGLANQFINIFHIFCMGIGMGASVLVARYFGMKDDSSLKKTITIMLRLVLIMSALFCIVTICIPRYIMMIYTNQTDFIDLGVEYLNYSVITYFLLGLSTTCTILLRNVDQIRIPLYTSIGAFFVNIGANYLFIFGPWIFPEMRVAGAAVGTLIARIFEVLVICGYLFFKEKKICYRLKEFFKPVGVLWKEYVRISIPVLISDGILALGNSSVTSVIGHLDEGFVAANSVTTVTQQLSSVMIQGFSQAGSIVTGQTLGQGEREKARKQGYIFLALGFLFGLVAAGIVTLISGPMISAYNLTPETAKIAEQLMLSISIIIVFQATNSIMTKGVLRGGGDTKMLMLADNIFLWIFALPLGVYAGFFTSASPFWIYLLLKSDQILKAFWCVIRLKGGKWIKRILTDDELEKQKK
ncbi:MAG: MATE family efflux transporter [Clostridia bacterium]|nr:MATE family efflux transporter [Clostridia bacterium]